MSYSYNNFQLGRGAVNCEALPTTITYHAYSSIEDDLFTITTNGYFPANFLFPLGNIIDGDFILISGSDGLIGGYTVSDVASGPLLSSDRIQTSVFPEISGTVAVAFAGPYSSPTPVTASYIIQGNIVTLIIPSFLGSFAHATPITSTALDAFLTPASAVVSSLNVVNNGVDVPGNIYVQSNGQLLISTYLSGGNFTSGSVGIRQSVISYFVQQQ